MVKLRSLPDGAEIDCAPGETVLEAALRADIPIAHACGGKAKCSTCRIWMLEGSEACPARAGAETELAERLRFSDDIRLACQLRPTGPVCFRRLVLDETDLRIANQLQRDQNANTGELRKVVLFFSDVTDFTAISKLLTPYDVMFLMNRYFSQVGDVIEQNNGYLDKYVGDGLMAIFGINGEKDAPIRAVNAALKTLEAVDRMKPFFSSMYGIDFDIRIGLHLGDAVIGTMGSAGHDRLTAIGDEVNVASRVENANKEAGTRLLVSEPLYEAVEDQVEVADFIRVRLRGTSDRITLYEITGLKPETERELGATAARDEMHRAGMTWRKAVEAASLKDGEPVVIAFPNFYAVVVKKDDRVFAFNNACPHLKLPLFEAGPGAPAESCIDDDGILKCRWHESCFDITTGEIVSWCDALNDSGMSDHMPQLGDISKNRAPLNLINWREEEGHIWLAVE